MVVHDQGEDSARDENMPDRKCISRYLTVHWPVWNYHSVVVSETVLSSESKGLRTCIDKR